MNEIFRQHVESLHAKYEALIGMQPVLLQTLPKDMPRSGIYVFSEGDAHLYVGRSKRLRDRLNYHSSSANDAPFAFKLAREQTGHLKASYSKQDSRGQLLADNNFLTAYIAAKDRIRRMQIRFVEERDTNRQALLEIYVTISLQTPYNDFDTH